MKKVKRWRRRLIRRGGAGHIKRGSCPMPKRHGAQVKL
jgi:hypothetical protein